MSPLQHFAFIVLIWKSQAYFSISAVPTPALPIQATLCVSCFNGGSIYNCMRDSLINVFKEKKWSCTRLHHFKTQGGKPSTTRTRSRFFCYPIPSGGCANPTKYHLSCRRSSSGFHRKFISISASSTLPSYSHWEEVRSSF
ncbi:hypothetical protein F5Y05DRAFT_123755 [Hypoxylon sp. FL0543]|nr:hypothetical protein F5Y05DRAFT_123755 [Hypoxylon sp. FL0543]